MLTRPFTFQRLEAVTWWNLEVVKRFGGVQHDELSKGDPLQFRREPPGPVPVEKAFRLPVTEAPDHEGIITEPVKACQETPRRLSVKLPA
jgi:hypothetical protein